MDVGGNLLGEGLDVCLGLSFPDTHSPSSDGTNLGTHLLVDSQGGIDHRGIGIGTYEWNHPGSLPLHIPPVLC